MIRRLLLLSMLGLSAAIALGFLGFAHPAFDTIAQFRLHFGATLLALAALWTIRCSRVPALLFAGVGFGAIVFSAPGLAGVATRDRAITGEAVHSLLQLNLRYDNPEPERVFETIGRLDADLLSLNEVSRAWQKKLESRLTGYPYSYHCPEWSRYGGVMIFSKFAFVPGSEFCGTYAALALNDVVIDGRTVTIGSAHLRWPWPASGPRLVTALTPRLRTLGADALIAGDFNAVTWSALLSRFAREGGLTIVDGIGPSWLHRWFPEGMIAIAGLPIDQALMKGDVRVVSARTLPPVGSDHLPVLVEFVVRDTECCKKK